ncbi:MAG: lipase family protein [Spirochaetales bacterium]|nr:lipase family protein [Spirochaetales bacterium]
MYYPKNFKHSRALQLAELVTQAYQQYWSFNKDKDWKLHGNYQLITELRYEGQFSSTLKNIPSFFRKEVGEWSRQKDSDKRGVPIGFIASHKSNVYLVFRGTSTTKEWLRDLNLHLSHFKYKNGVSVHEGFNDLYELFRENIFKTLSGLKGKKLYITGHSLGSALATLTAMDIACNMDIKLPRVYTFASPRVGDRKFSKEYNIFYKDRSFRIANTCDLVVSMPLPVPFLGFIGGYFTHTQAALEFTHQFEDLDKNHSLDTYLAFLKSTPRNRLSALYFNSLT